MSGAVCPSCGVAVVPGYVRCPKCHKALPRRANVVEGGTAVQATASRGPLIAILGAIVVGVAILALVASRKSDKPAPARAPVASAAQPTAAPSEQPAAADQPEAPAQPTGPSAQDVASELERALKKQRLWSTVSIIGDHVDVRSGSCSDPAMTPMLDGAASSFKAAGLTKLRCLEQSGRVVTDREL
jgi:hypothetical protein